MSVVRRDWTENELLKALALYHQLPFGQLHSRNAAIIRLATAINRTPSAVALKLVNFASLDPTLTARGISGMGNTSKLDRKMWDRFAHDWSRLAVAIPDSVVEEHTDRPIARTEVERLRRVRVGQGFFRNAVLSAFNFTCCITGISEPGLLRASHIVPWSDSNAHRLNPSNGLCLNSLHDSAFDMGLLTLDESFRLVLSRRLSSSMPAALHNLFFDVYRGKQISLPERNQPGRDFLDYHRANIFQR